MYVDSALARDGSAAAAEKFGIFLCGSGKFRWISKIDLVDDSISN